MSADGCVFVCSNEIEYAAQLDIPALYKSEGEAPVQRLAAAVGGTPAHGSETASLQALSGIVWTPSMRRMYTLVDRSEDRASSWSMPQGS